jgi:hypothetical protein
VSVGIEDLPNQDALGPWRPTGFADAQLPLSALREVQFSGGAQELYPTHPSMIIKYYHRYDRSQYRNRNLDGRDEACVLDMTTRMPDRARERHLQRLEESGRRLPCIKGDEAYDVVLSDTYVDDRGNLYRGVDAYAIMKQHESMGTGFSPGRTAYENPNSQFANDMYIGDTYAVPVGRFMMLAALLPQDHGKIQREQQNATRTHVRNGLLWRRRQ